MGITERPARKPLPRYIPTPNNRAVAGKMPRCSRYGWQVSIPCKVKPNGGWQAVGADVLADSFTGGGWVARPPNPQTAALHHCHQVDHMTADQAGPPRDARGGGAGRAPPRRL